MGLTGTRRLLCGVVGEISTVAGGLVPSPLPSSGTIDRGLLVYIIEEVLNGLVVV